MASQESSTELHLAVANRGALLAGAVAIHVGLAIVCVSAIYTGWQRALVSLPQWGAMLVVAATLLYAGFSRGGVGVQPLWVRLLSALGALMVLGLCYDPQLSAIPRLGEELPAVFADAYPSIALVGVVIALVGWLAYVGAGGEMGRGPAPMRRSAALTVGLVAGFSVFAYALLHPAHALPGSATLRPILMAFQGGALVGILPGAVGGVGVRRAPHLYLGVTLILAFVRNMVFPMQ